MPINTLWWETGYWEQDDWAFQGDVDATLYTMLDTLPSWWNKAGRSSPGSNTYEILASFAQEFAGYSDEVRNMKREVPVDSSTGTYLDQLGLFYLLVRKSNEIDSDFRGRIKSFRTTFAGGGTKEAIENAVFQEFDGAVIVVSDDPGLTWCKAKIDMTTTEWLKIQGREDDYFALLENVKASGIKLKTNIFMVNPVFNEIMYHGELASFSLGLKEEENISHPESVKFNADLLLPIDMIWDLGTWDYSDWATDLMYHSEVVTFNVGTRFEETFSTSEVYSFGLNYAPTESQSSFETVTFAASKAMSESMANSEAVDFVTNLIWDGDGITGNWNEAEWNV